MLTKKRAFAAYLERAVKVAVADDKSKEDSGNLMWILDRASRGVKRNWKTLRPEEFLAEYLWCVGSIRKKFTTHTEKYPDQEKLFCGCDPKKIARNAKAIRSTWKKSKCDLNSRMFEAVISTASTMADGWDGFKTQYLLLPDNPESESLDDWWDAYDALDGLPMVGWAIGWYLIRNLYGAPFFKPDLHINEIVAHFFGPEKLVEMTEVVHELWPKVCSEKRLLPTHIGVVDHILWWYRQKTGDPPANA